jgi:hypothetical protein
MRNREALEEAVYAAYPDLGMDDIERLETDKLEWMLEIKQGKRKPPAPERKEAKTTKKPVSVWEKIGTGYEVREGALVHVEKWRTSNEAGHAVREYVQQCGSRVSFEGRMVAASRLLHFLTTDQWVKRVPKLRKTYRAQVREGSRVVYLGLFATAEERDAAVFAYRLGVYPIGSKSA